MEPFHFEGVDLFKKFQIEHANFRADLTRIDDREYYELWQRSIAIEDESWLGSRIFQIPDPVENMNIARTRTALDLFSGKSGKCFDTYKGSFSFPFLVIITRKTETGVVKTRSYESDSIEATQEPQPKTVLKEQEAQVYRYLLDIRDYRGTVEFCFRKIVANRKTKDDRLHPPIENEFSRPEINFVCNYLCGSIEAALDMYMTIASPTPFHAVIQSNLILYGYRQGKFFAHQYDNEVDFENAARSLTSTLVSY